MIHVMNVEDFLRDRGLKYHRSNGEVRVNCPRCGDTKEHLYINAETWLFHCKKCDWRGNRTLLDQEIGGSKPASLPGRTSITDLVEASIHFLASNLPPRIVEGLERRGLTRETISQQKIGWAINPDGLRRHLNELNFDREAVKSSGILRLAGGGWFLRNRIVIPYWSKGKLVWYRGRIDPDGGDGPKYISPARWKVRLYNEDVIETADDRIFICEGEPDTWALMAQGLPVVGIPGAGTFKEEWVPLFARFRLIYVCLDPDQAGRSGAARIARLLGDRVRLVELPSGVDVNDFFYAEGHTKDDFSALVRSAQSPAAEERNLLQPVHEELRDAPGPPALRVPKGWRLLRDGLFQIEIGRNGAPVETLIAPAPFFISGRSSNIDTREERLELTYLRDGSWRSMRLDRSSAMDHRRIATMAAYGLPITSLNGRDVVQFLQAFEAANSDHIPHQHTIAGFGWKEDGGRRFYVLGRQAIGAAALEIVHEAESLGEERLARSVRSSGQLDEWLNAMRLLVSYPRVLFGLYASFVPPLMELLDLPNFIVDFAGASSQGKTTAISIAASVWGLPTREQGGLITGWDATKVSIERLAALFNHMPIFLDDSQTVNEQTLQQIVYMVANGVGRLRGAIKGMQATPFWRVVAFSTGERALVDVTEFEGAKARTISMFGSPFGTASATRTIHRLQTAARFHYGHAGPIFVTEIVRLAASPEDRQTLKSSYEFVQRMLSERGKTNIADRMAQYFAAVFVAAQLAERLFNFGGDPLTVVTEAFAEACNDQGETDTARRALDFLASWTSSNQSFFDVNDERASAERSEAYGVIRKGDYVAVFPHKLKEVLSRHNFPYQTVLKTWMARGWIQGAKGHLTVPVRFRSELERMVKITWKALYDVPQTEEEPSQ
jgi:uncharacterized protein (DUF927 family)